MNGGEDRWSCTISPAMEDGLSTRKDISVCGRKYAEHFSLEMQIGIFMGSISGANQLGKPPVLHDYSSFISTNIY